MTELEITYQKILDLFAFIHKLEEDLKITYPIHQN